MWRDKKVLVTGGGGFLGGALIKRLLDLGVAAIRSVGRTPRPALERLGVECALGDIADPRVLEVACRGCDIVFHVAAKAGVWGKAEEFRSANVAGTANAIDGCLKASVPLLVHTSSPSVVFSMGDLENADESLPYPVKYPAWYPATKAEAERMVIRSASKDLRTISLRPHLIWGVGDNHILPGIARRAASGALKRIGNGANKVDMTHISNAAQAHILAAEALFESDDLSGKVYFVSDGAPVNLWSWIDEFLARMDLPGIEKSVSFKTAYAVGAVLEFIHTVLRLEKEPLMTRFVAAELAHSHYFDISAAKRDLGYSPSLDVDKALSDAVEWLKGQPELYGR